MTREKDATPPASVIIHRHMDERHDVIVAQGDFGGLIAAWREHVEMWDQPMDGLVDVMMRQALAAAALRLSCRPRDELFAWTINIKSPPINIFVTADTSRSTVTGRAYTDGVQTADSSRFYAETSRADGRNNKSVVDVTGLDVLQIVEQFHERSEQVAARLFELSDTQHLYLFGLPDADREWLQGLDRDGAREVAATTDSLKHLDDREVWFQCGCNPDRILGVVRGVWRDRADDLFRGDSRVEVTCPRCGRRWWITRQRFENDDASPE